MMTTLWGVRECAHYLRRSPSWVYHATSRGELPYRRIGGRLAFEPEVIRAWVQRQPGSSLAATLETLHSETSRILQAPGQHAWSGSRLTKDALDNSIDSSLNVAPKNSP